MKSLQKGKILFEQQKYEEAIFELTNFLEVNINNADALYTRAISFRKIGNYDNAIADLTQMLNRLPEEASLFCERGIAYFLKKDFKNALADMDKAVLLEPKNPYRYTSRAYIKANVDVKGAINDYKKAIELDANDEIAYNNLGLLEENIGKISSAKKHFKKADELIAYHPKEKYKKEDSNPQENKTIGKIMLSVFTSKEMRQEYFQFVKSIFKNKALNK